MIFNSPFEYDVIETFIRAHEELVYSVRLSDLIAFLSRRVEYVMDGSMDQSVSH